MLVGKFPVKLDSKNRVQVPLRLREAGGAQGHPWSRFYLTTGTTKCIFVYTPEGFKRLMDEMGANKALADEHLQLVQRIIGGSLDERECDKEGRIVLSEELQAHAGIRQDAIWVGAVSRAEIWNRDQYNAYIEKHTPELGQGIDIVSRAGLALPKADQSGRGPLP